MGEKYFWLGRGRWVKMVRLRSFYSAHHLGWNDFLLNLERKWEGGSEFAGKLSICPPAIQWFFFFPYILLNFYLSTIDIGVDLYNLHFLYSHFSSQLNNFFFFYSFTFPLPPTKHHERKTKSLLTLNFFIPSPFSIPHFSTPTKQTPNFLQKNYYYYY